MFLLKPLIIPVKPSMDWIRDEKQKNDFKVNILKGWIGNYETR